MICITLSLSTQIKSFHQYAVEKGGAQISETPNTFRTRKVLEPPWRGAWGCARARKCVSVNVHVHTCVCVFKPWEPISDIIFRSYNSKRQGREAAAVFGPGRQDPRPPPGGAVSAEKVENCVRSDSAMDASLPGTELALSPLQGHLPSRSHQEEGTEMRGIPHQSLPPRGFHRMWLWNLEPFKNARL